MDEKIVQEILHELFSSLEDFDTRSAAILQFLKAKGIASDEELAPFLEQAENASSVRWLAVRVRMDYLISSAIKGAEQGSAKQLVAPAEKGSTQEQTATERPEKENHETETDMKEGTGRENSQHVQQDADKRKVGGAAARGADADETSADNASGDQAAPEKAA
jgi:hypothetical protein